MYMKYFLQYNICNKLRVKFNSMTYMEVYWNTKSYLKYNLHKDVSKIYIFIQLHRRKTIPGKLFIIAVESNSHNSTFLDFTVETKHCILFLFVKFKSTFPESCPKHCSFITILS